jgi:hypothetical protein
VAADEVPAQVWGTILSSLFQILESKGTPQLVAEQEYIMRGESCARLLLLLLFFFFALILFFPIFFFFFPNNNNKKQK